MAASLRLISFSLFGDSARYTAGMLRNLIVAPVVYPGWKVVVFHDRSVKPVVLEEIRRLGGHPVRMDGRIPPEAFRFVAATLPGVERVIFRDADSRLGVRERDAVEEWIASGLPFHAMRDHPWHERPVLAGLWGCVGGSLPGLRGRLRHFPWTGRYGQDEHFLEREVWTAHQAGFLVHDSHGHSSGTRPFPVARTDCHFIGERLDALGRALDDDWKMLQDLPDEKPVSISPYPSAAASSSASHPAASTGRTVAVILTNARDGTPHREAIIRANPEMEVHVQSGPELDGDARHHAWRNCDSLIRDWWRDTGRHSAFDHALFLEWDVLCNAPLDELFAEDSGEDFLVGNVIPAKSDWIWWSEVRHLPKTLKPHASGISPLAVMRFSRRCLEAMYSHPATDDLYQRDLFCELRAPTLAAASGFPPKATPALRHVRWAVCPVPGHERTRGIYHPVKSAAS